MCVSASVQPLSEVNPLHFMCLSRFGSILDRLVLSKFCLLLLFISSFIQLLLKRIADCTNLLKCLSDNDFGEQFVNNVRTESAIYRDHGFIDRNKIYEAALRLSTLFTALKGCSHITVINTAGIKVTCVKPKGEKSPSEVIT